MLARHTLGSVVRELVSGLEDGSVTYPEEWVEPADQEFEAQVPADAFPGLRLKTGGVMIRGEGTPAGRVRFSVGPVDGDTWEEREVATASAREETFTFGPVGVGVTTSRASDQINLRVRVWSMGPSANPAVAS